MNKVYLLLGSNLSDRALFLLNARKFIEERIGKIKKQSRIYESAPWGFVTDNVFLNQVILIYTFLKPEEILEKIKIIEKELGRIRTSKGYASRTIDIDILFYNDEIILQHDLKIPHPQLHKRKFTLVPLNEIDTELNHPIFGKSIKMLLNECDDNSEVTIFE
ncbi:MAG: 2-amino-4-hydroxy-6-hydroxymethyldihydropteridine diphosphokinase [Bacteroidales bacterium]